MSNSVEVGNVVEGVVTGITNFGAFVELPNGKTGLVHISEIADAYVHEVSDYVKHNDRIKVKVLSISEGGEKIGLSLRQANPGPPEFITPDQDGKSNEPVEDKIKRFMKESEEKLNEMRRNRNNRRGGRDPRR